MEKREGSGILVGVFDVDGVGCAVLGQGNAQLLSLFYADVFERFCAAGFGQDLRDVPLDRCKSNYITLQHIWWSRAERTSE